MNTSPLATATTSTPEKPRRAGSAIALFAVLFGFSATAQQFDLRCNCDTATLKCSCQIVVPTTTSSPTGQTGVTTDTSPKSVVAIPRPAPGQVITEPTFGTKIVRITSDINPSNGQPWSWVHMHTNNAFSLDNRWITYYGQPGMGGYLARFDPVNLTVTQVWKQYGPAPNSSRIFDPFPVVWSTKNPNGAWTVAGLKIGYWDFSKGTYTVIADLKDKLPPEVAYLVFRDMSADESRFVLQTQDNTYKYLGMLVYDIPQQRVVYLRNAPGIKPNMDNTGKWVVSVVPDEIIEVDTGYSRLFPQNFVWHASYGYETIYGPDSARHDLRKFNLRTLVSSVILAQTPSTDWTQGTHTSITIDEKWLCVSRFSQDSSGFSTGGWLRDEIALVATDGSGKLKRLAHHRSNWLSSGNYWHMPRAAVSYDGRFVVFTSNWGDVSRSDVYVIAVP